MDLDSVPVIGPIGPYFDGVDAEHWDALNRGKFMVQQCPDCSTWIWGASWRCPSCGCWEPAWREIAPKGTVYSWIRTHQAFAPEVKDVLPYVSLIVELPHAGGRRMIGTLVGKEDGLRIGAPVEGVIQKASDLTGGQAVMRWRLGKAG